MDQLKNKYITYLEITKGRSKSTLTNYTHFLDTFIEIVKIDRVKSLKTQYKTFVYG